MPRAFLALLAAAACSVSPAGPPAQGPERAGSGGGGSGEGGSGGSGGFVPRLCTPGDRRWCQRADTSDEQRNVGACRDGSQLCADGSGWGPCTGGVGPSAEPATCDRVDQDCDGENVPAGLDCRGCSDEVCGNGIDDDCDGRVDPIGRCPLSCRDADPVEMACCHQDPEGRDADRPVTHSWRCVESPSLPPCAERPCLVLYAGAFCAMRCDPEGCFCGMPGDRRPQETFACGFATPCALLGCEDRKAQPCYTGTPATLGVGICHGGLASCTAAAWGTCEGQQLPLPEVCGNGLDDDCDGVVDEEDAVTHKRCPVVCTPSPEVCNRVDDDCDGFVDETCEPRADEQTCYVGPPRTDDRNACSGTQHEEMGWWSMCGSFGPQPEICGDGIDSDCNGLGSGHEDPGCCRPIGREMCNGVDDDCNGLVDEGVLNACGNCGDACSVQEFHEPASCFERNDRTCDRIIPDENNPDAFTLSTDSRGCCSTNLLYVAAPLRGEVAKLDTITGQKLWQVDAHLAHPTHLAVPLDRSVWVGGDDVAHLDRDGNLICLLDGGSAGLAIDPYGDVWTVSYAGQLRKVSGTGVGAPGIDGIPRCDLHDLAPDDPGTDALELGVAVDGLAITEEGILWTGSAPAVRLDTTTGASERIAHADALGVAVDGAGNAWYGGAPIHALAAFGPYASPRVYEQTAKARGSLPAIADDGAVWAQDGPTLVKVDPIGLDAVSTILPDVAQGVAVDDAGKVWAVGETGIAHRFDPVNLTLASFDVDRGHDTLARGDFSGEGLRQFTVRQGVWTQIADSAYLSTRWNRLDWQQLEPEGTRIEATLFFADRREDLAARALACGPFDAPPADLSSCPGAHGKRFVAIRFTLRAARDGRKPTVGHVSLAWTRP